MDTAAVIYDSKYGSTRQYAQWIADDLHCPLYERKTVSISDLEDVEVLIYGGAIYAGGVSGVKFLRKHFDALKSKQLVLFTCGASNPADNANTDHIRANLRKTLTEPVMRQLTIFHLRGAIDYSKLNPLHRAMMAMMIRPLKKKDPSALTAEEQHMLATYGKAVSFVDRSAVKPIVEYVRGL